jgi:Tryptophanyl-tRNA synthetase
MRPTGRFHLGNYLGAAQNWVNLQNEYDCYYFVADYHALTTEPDGHTVESKIFDLTADLIAVGLDPKRSVIYQQSKVPEVAELALLLSMVTPLSWVLRTPTFKEMVKKHPDNVNLGLLSYPVLQGADIIIVKRGARRQGPAPPPRADSRGRPQVQPHLRARLPRAEGAAH